MILVHTAFAFAVSIATLGAVTYPLIMLLSTLGFVAYGLYLLRNPLRQGGRRPEEAWALTREVSENSPQQPPLAVAFRGP